ncbi:MAG: AAA family ATPase [Methanomassiliicoccales archaeon]|nr:AAA family ATPase [Methanomassiliicoccales archaeon]
MPIKIAVSGKGGVGKTTIAAVLSRLYGREGRKVLAVDADPSPSLMAAVGIPEKERLKAKPLATMYDLIEERTGVRPGQPSGGMFKLNPKVNDLMESYSVEGPDKVEVLLLGTISTAGGGCFCPESTLLKRVMDHLLLEEDEIVIMDMEAGLEHLGRATARSVDIMLAVVEPGQRSIETAAKIRDLAKELGVTRILAVINKAPSRMVAKQIEDELRIKFEIETIGSLPYAQALVDADLNGIPAMEQPGTEEFVSAVSRLKTRLDEIAIAG